MQCPGMTAGLRALAGVLLMAASWAGRAAAGTPEPLPTPQILNCGVSLEEFLQTPGAIQRYAVEVPAGATLTVNVSDTSGTLGLIRLRTSPEDETCSGTLMLTHPGTNIVEASDCFEDETGSYTISLNGVSQTGSCGSHPLGCGATLRVLSFAIAGEIDAYTFMGAPGDLVTVTAVDVGGTIGFVRLRIFDPDGLLISTADSCQSSNKVVVLEKPGLHTALATACGLPAAGTYGIALESTSCPAGPDITYFGIATADGTTLEPTLYEGDGRPLYDVTTGADFSVVIEGRPGSSGEAVGTQAFTWDAEDPTVLPDLQVLISQALGDGSSTVCDKTPPSVGGVPATDPFEYALTQPVADAINDFGCRVNDGSGQPQAVVDGAAACTRSTDSLPGFVDPTTTAQFCAPIAPGWAFPPGGAFVKARLRDAQGALGAEREMVVRLDTPDPCPADCDGDRLVVINELLVAVRVALGATPLSACEVADVNRDGSVQINELIRGINSALLGCPAE